MSFDYCDFQINSAHIYIDPKKGDVHAKENINMFFFL